ncbi:peptidoglycan DD-metalloendopeptidase family protein [Paeniglutamicibacter sp. MACA_103]|uniref:M23 family metallopeptidase n=1 Tax=Paeniglutamicibacter sp. MACA_103 TaxID=3377337 RepID=UPI0038956E63
MAISGAPGLGLAQDQLAPQPAGGVSYQAAAYVQPVRVSLFSGVDAISSQSLGITSAGSGDGGLVPSYVTHAGFAPSIATQQNAVGALGGQRVGVLGALPGKIQLMHPVATLHITSPYGWRHNPTGPGTQIHVGQDYAVPCGSPVYASADGVVIQSAWAGHSGMRVTIDHGSSVHTGYSHNSMLIAKVGDTVKQGQLIALSGTTGNSTGCHVHFEVIINGRWNDPRNFLPPVAGQPNPMIDSRHTTIAAEPIRNSGAPRSHAANTGDTPDHWVWVPRSYVSGAAPSRHVPKAKLKAEPQPTHKSAVKPKPAAKPKPTPQVKEQPSTKPAPTVKPAPKPNASPKPAPKPAPKPPTTKAPAPDTQEELPHTTSPEPSESPTTTAPDPTTTVPEPNEVPTVTVPLPEPDVEEPPADPADEPPAPDDEPESPEVVTPQAPDAEVGGPAEQPKVDAPNTEPDDGAPTEQDSDNQAPAVQKAPVVQESKVVEAEPAPAAQPRTVAAPAPEAVTPKKVVAKPKAVAVPAPKAVAKPKTVAAPAPKAVAPKKVVAKSKPVAKAPVKKVVAPAPVQKVPVAKAPVKKVAAPAPVKKVVVAKPKVVEPAPKPAAATTGQTPAAPGGAVDKDQ